MSTGWPTAGLRCCTWIHDAEQAGVAEPKRDGAGDRRRRPAGDRTVLCKSVDADGVTFLHEPRLGQGGTGGDALRRGDVLVCPWGGPACAARSQQGHVAGDCQYWARPRGSQLGRKASSKSQPVASRADLLAQLDDVTARFADSETVPVPLHWGGYRIAAEVVEFWQGGRTGCTTGFW